ncbi:MAG: hypothetical protein IBJ17_17860, partial [Reyranella sp.]|nr:hypothetical protein [Reyranella sp.]
MKKSALGALAASALVAPQARPGVAAEELSVAQPAGGAAFTYLLTSQPGQPRYAVILMPGGRGILDPRVENGRIAVSMGGNFLIRSRGLFADGRFVAASTDATTTPDRILAIVQDLQRRYGPQLQVYVLGTSRSTDATMALSAPLDGKVAGFVHTSSTNGIASLDPRRYRSRHLIVYHKNDACRVTQPSASVASGRSYGTETIEMTGGTSVGEDCEARAHHGYNGIERETVDRIKAWIAKGV